MKTKILILGLIFLVLIACKKGIENPYSSKTPIPEPQPQANVIFVGASVSCGWNATVQQFSCSIYGAIKNIGNGDAVAIKIHVKIVNSAGATLRSFSFVFIHPDYQYSILKAGEQKKIQYSWYGVSAEHYQAFDETNSNNAKFITWENVN